MKESGFRIQDSEEGCQVSGDGCQDGATKRPVTYYLLPVTLLIVFLASIPYLMGLLFQPKGGVFTGFTFNIDDACVYCSWIRQIADGSLLIRNQFTSVHQTALQFNIFFVLLGLIARVTHLSPTAVFHIARIGLGVALLLLVRKFSLRFLKTPLERALIVPIVGLSGGLCWLISGIGNHAGPVDFWQPEAITFLSIYLNPLFLAGLILMIGALHFLYRMHESGSWRDAFLAGLMLMLLANVHTYDIVTVGAVWAVYLLAKMAKDRKIAWKTIGQSLVAALIAAPALAYQVYLLSHEQAFKARAATPAPSPALWAYLAGYGLVLILAAFGGWQALRERRGALMLVVWSIIGFALPYLPYAQQRKFVMGLHIPLAILATIAVARIAGRCAKKHDKAILSLSKEADQQMLHPSTGSGWQNIAVAFLLVLIILPSNLLLMQNRTRMAEDINLLKQQTTAPHVSPYLPVSQLDALRWLRTHSSRDDIVLAFPDTALFTPVVAGNPVYYGHWSETPDYNKKLAEWWTFINASTPDEWRRSFLKESGAKYIIYPADASGQSIDDMQLFDLRNSNYVELVFESGDTAVYRVVESLRH